MNNLSSLKLAIGTVAFLAIGFQSAHANLVANGGFESPVISAGTYSAFDVGQSFDSWLVIGTSGQSNAVAIVSGTFTEPPVPYYNYSAQQGNQWLDLTGVGVNGPNGVQQTITTTVGEKYELSFWVGNVSGLDRGPTSTIETFIDGLSLGTSTNSTPGTVLSWTEYNYSFVATNSMTTIAFVSRDPFNDHLNGLDNVSVVAAPIPEPEIYAMMGLGLGLLGWVGRCRRQQAQ